jgi:O-Antigen ligase
MNLITAIPGLIALLVCIRRGPERALIDVYLPTLLLLPDSYHWMITGHLSFNQTAIIPIGGFLIARSWRNWQWSFLDLLVISYVAMSVTSEFVNTNFYSARNVALQSICNSILVYVVAKGIIPREDLYASIAKRIVVCLAIVAIVSIYEFRMGRNPFDMILAPLFPGQYSAVWVARYGFLRPAGPYGHAILAGLMFAVGYRLTRWLEWGGYWPGNVSALPLSKVRFCQFCLIAGSVMTLSRGPWLAAGIAALVVGLGRARNRRHAIVVTALLILVVGIPFFQMARSYIWVERSQATSEMEETAAYRHELIERYIAIVEERPVWGWGRNNFPTIDGMRSVDNHYLLLALTYGEFVLALFVVIILSEMTRLTRFCASHHGSAFPGSIALTFLGIYFVVVVSIGTVWLGGQTVQLFFLILGWGEGLVLTRSLKPIVGVRMPAQSVKSKIQMVMA